LYAWIVIHLFRVGRTLPRLHGEQHGCFLDAELRRLWPILLAVYLFNGSFVVMNYQFVNGIIFSLAGILAAQNRRQGGSKHAAVL